MKRYLPVILLLLVIHLILLINLRFTAWPEMLSFPYLKNSGYLLYKDMIHPYPPVLTMALGLVYKLFGYKLIALKIFTWLIILVNDVFIFLIVKKLTGKKTLAFLSLFFYVTFQPFLEGNQLWFDLAAAPAILTGTLFLLNKKYFWAGVAFAAAALTKQTAGLFIIFSLIYVLWKTRTLKSGLLFLSGPAILGGVFLIRLVAGGELSGFLNWNLIYPFLYWSKFPGYVEMALSKHQSLFIFLLSFPMFLLIFYRKFSFLIFYFLISLMMIYPRFSFFHFQTGIAFFAILSGLLLSKVKVKPPAIGLFWVAAFVFMSLPKFEIDWQKETRFWSEADIKEAEIIKAATKSSDRIYLLGLNSNLYVFSERLPPKPWCDNFSWYFEIPGVQEKIIESWQNDKPRMIFSTEPLPGNWFDLGTYRPQKIVDWIKNEKIENRVLK